MHTILNWIFALCLNLFIAEIIRRIVRARRRTERATGRVVRVAAQGAWRTMSSPVVEFLDKAGVRREFSSSAGTSWDHWAGRTRVDVSYDPKDPSNAELAPSELWEATLVGFILLAVVVAVVGTLWLLDVFDHIP